MDDSATLKEARAWLQAKAMEGESCPCCAQFVKVYKRALNAAMARSLIWLVRRWQTQQGWIDVPKTAPDWLVRSRELPKLAYWALVTPKPNETDPAKRCLGLWLPTQAGVDFVCSPLSRVPSHAFVYNKRVVDFATTQTGIREALGKNFDYAELMAAR